MNQEHLIVKRALKEMKELILENKALKEENQKLKSINQNPDISIDIDSFNSKGIDKHLLEAKEAMDRYNIKIRKEIAKYAKQKQGKRK